MDGEADRRVESKQGADVAAYTVWLSVDRRYELEPFIQQQPRNYLAVRTEADDGDTQLRGFHVHDCWSEFTTSGDCLRGAVAEDKAEGPMWRTVIPADSA